ncbi:MAG TPA: hypothetical protein ENI95_14845 [Chloroflexi bacterium]|nr:hypothetical protein [Chloroflexota bacterium]
MVESFINALAENMADVLTIAGVIGLLAGAVLFWRARERRVKRFRQQIKGEVPVASEFKEKLAKALNADVAEMAAIGTVTFVDIAWHYSMADPQIWDHFQGLPADHLADAMQNLDVLKASLGDQAVPILGNIVEYFQNFEAVQVFHDLVDQLSHLGSAGETATLVLSSQGDALADALTGPTSLGTSVEAKASALGEGTLLHYIPLVTLSFATYRAWRRSQKGAEIGRNIEFATIEVATRAGGGLMGGKIGGVVGTFVMPGLGTVVGSVAGAVAGAVGGAFLGEEIKRRHIRQAQEALEQSLTELGQTYLADPAKYRQLTEVFVEQEKRYIESLHEVQRKLRRHALPWRRLWPDQKLIFLEETVARAQEGLNEIKLGTVDALDHLAYMRDQKQYRKMGLILWGDPAMRQQLDCEPHLIERVQDANERLVRELKQFGRAVEALPA